MKITLLTTALLTMLSAATFAQNTADSTGRTSAATPGSNKPIISDQTKQDVQQATTQVANKVAAEVEKSRTYNEEYGLTWFQQGSYFVGGSLGFGGSNGAQIVLSPRIGYFFQPGFMAGIRYDADRRLGSSFHQRQGGPFVRYYPFRTRVSSFIGAGYNFGRQFSNDITSNAKVRYNSVNLEIGIMFWILQSLGAEASIENNYYDRYDASGGNAKGARFKVGINYYIGRFRPAQRR